MVTKKEMDKQLKIAPKEVMVSILLPVDIVKWIKTEPNAIEIIRKVMRAETNHA